MTAPISDLATLPTQYAAVVREMAELIVRLQRLAQLKGLIELHAAIAGVTLEATRHIPDADGGL